MVKHLKNIKKDVLIIKQYFNKTNKLEEVSILAAFSL